MSLDEHKENNFTINWGAFPKRNQQESLFKKMTSNTYIYSK